MQCKSKAYHKPESNLYRRVFTSYNEKGIHVWHPESAEKLFQVNFDVASAAQAAEQNADEAAEII